MFSLQIDTTHVAAQRVKADILVNNAGMRAAFVNVLMRR
jgi:hypothetical protein